MPMGGHSMKKKKTNIRTFSVNMLVDKLNTDLFIKY